MSFKNKIQKSKFKVTLDSEKIVALREALSSKEREVESLTDTCSSYEKQIDELSKNQKRTVKFQEQVEERLALLTAPITSPSRPTGVPANKNDVSVDPGESPLIASHNVFELINCVKEELERNRMKEKTAIELQMEDLETRVTELHGMYAQLQFVLMSVEDQLHEALELNDVEQIHEHIKSRCIPCSSACSPLEVAAKHTQNTCSNVSDKTEESIPDIMWRFPPRKAVGELYPRSLIKPEVKGPGDTHIRKMDPNLRKHISEELSRERESRCDWREFGLRVGLSSGTVRSWEELYLPCPMNQVLAFWGDSPGATVRLLHRHLHCPAIEATFLAKYVTDYYDVE